MGTSIKIFFLNINLSLRGFCHSSARLGKTALFKSKYRNKYYENAQGAHKDDVSCIKLFTEYDPSEKYFSNFREDG